MNLVKIISFLCGASLFTAGCTNEHTVSYQSGGMTETISQDKSTYSNFPLPIYPHSQPQGSVKAEDNNETSNFLMLSSSDPIQKVQTFYETELAKNGWEIEQKQVLPDSVNITVKKDSKEANLMLISQNNKTDISLSICHEPEGKLPVGTQEGSPDKLNPPTD